MNHHYELLEFLRVPEEENGRKKRLMQWIGGVHVLLVHCSEVHSYLVNELNNF